MGMTKNNAFVELSNNEMMAVDGGTGPQIATKIAIGMAIVVYTVVKLFKK